MFRLRTKDEFVASFPTFTTDKKRTADGREAARSHYRHVSRNLAKIKKARPGLKNNGKSRPHVTCMTRKRQGGIDFFPAMFLEHQPARGEMLDT